MQNLFRNLPAASRQRIWIQDLPNRRSLSDAGRTRAATAKLKLPKSATLNLEWAEEESARQRAEGAEGPGLPASSRDGESSERPRVQCESNAGIVNEGMHLEAMTNPVRYDGAAQDERVGPAGAEPAAEAAECTSESENSGRGTQTGGRRTKVGKTGTARAPTTFSILSYSYMYQDRYTLIYRSATTPPPHHHHHTKPNPTANGGRPGRGREHLRSRVKELDEERVQSSDEERVRSSYSQAVPRGDKGPGFAENSVCGWAKTKINH